MLKNNYLCIIKASDQNFNKDCVFKWKKDSWIRPNLYYWVSPIIFIIVVSNIIFVFFLSRSRILEPITNGFLFFQPAFSYFLTPSRYILLENYVGDFYHFATLIERNIIKDSNCCSSSLTRLGNGPRTLNTLSQVNMIPDLKDKHLCYNLGAVICIVVN